VPEVIEIVVYAIALIVSTVLVLRYDDKKMTFEQRQRAWPPASRMAAISFAVFCFPITLPVHFWRTRRSLRGVAIGIVAGFMVVVISSLIGGLAGTLVEAVVTSPRK
jgi:NADH:ubiquinone oxidoreductase subunit 6 (subunit J)